LAPFGVQNKDPVVGLGSSRHNSSATDGAVVDAESVGTIEGCGAGLVASVRFRNRRVGLTVHSVRRLVSKLLPLQSHFD
jgi:hypothetical protein